MMLFADAPAVNLKDLLGPVWGPLAAAGGAIFGGAGLKWIDNRYTARSKKTDIEVKLHDEARDEVKEMRVRLDRMDVLLREKDRQHNRTMILYNTLRMRAGLTVDFNDPAVDKDVQEMMLALESSKKKAGKTQTKPEE